MRILAFTDIHENIKALEHVLAKAKSYDVELLVCAGDFTIFGNKTEHIMKLMDAANIPILLIHGNHEDEEMVGKIAKKSKNIKFIHKDAHEYKGFVFIGYGGGGFSHRDSEFSRFITSHKRTKNVILVTHQPPYHTMLDEVHDGMYSGNMDFRKFIDESKPLIAICGHIHEHANKQDMIKETFVINPGPLGRVLEIEHETDNKKK